MRKKHHEEHVNHEAWAIPYADLMTLLLAFFVVMYAVSVVNEGKFRVMSRSIDEAFNGTSHVIAPLGPSTLTPHALAPPLSQSGTLGKALLAPINAPIAMIHPPGSSNHGADTGRLGVGKSAAPNAISSLDHIENQVRRALQPLVDKNWVAVRRKQDWLEIEIRTDILFPSGVARLSPSSDQVLQSLAAILAPFSNSLRVEGFTDNVPINTNLYPSNWELSAARAASVARLFASGGVNPDRLGIVGWGEVRPIADNATADGRNSNRRVMVVVMSDLPVPPRGQSAADRIAADAGLSAVSQTPALPPTYVSDPRPQSNNGSASSAPTIAAQTNLEVPVVGAVLPVVPIISVLTVVTPAGLPPARPTVPASTPRPFDHASNAAPLGEANTLAPAVR